MSALTTARWRPKTAILPALRYLQQPAQLVRAYHRANLRADLIGGLTVGVVLLPQAIAFSLLAELPPQMGLSSAPHSHSADDKNPNRQIDFTWRAPASGSCERLEWWPVVPSFRLRS